MQLTVDILYVKAKRIGAKLSLALLEPRMGILELCDAAPRKKSRFHAVLFLAAAQRHAHRVLLFFRLLAFLGFLTSFTMHDIVTDSVWMSNFLTF